MPEVSALLTHDHEQIQRGLSDWDDIESLVCCVGPELSGPSADLVARNALHLERYEAAE